MNGLYLYRLTRWALDYAIFNVLGIKGHARAGYAVDG